MKLTFLLLTTETLPTLSGPNRLDGISQRRIGLITNHGRTWLEKLRMTCFGILPSVFHLLATIRQVTWQRFKGLTRSN